MLRRALARRSAASKLAAAQTSASNDVGSASKSNNSDADMWKSSRHSVVSSNGSEGQLIVTVGGAGSTLPPRSETASVSTSKIPVQQTTKSRKYKRTSTSSKVSKSKKSDTSSKKSSSKRGNGSKSDRKSAKRSSRSSSRNKTSRSRTRQPDKERAAEKGEQRSRPHASQPKAAPTAALLSTKGINSTIPPASTTDKSSKGADGTECTRKCQEDDNKSTRSHRTADSAASEGNTTVSSITQTLALCPLQQAAAYPELAASLQRDESQPLIERTLACPPGPLSIQIRYCATTGGPVIDDVLASSPMACLLFSGDRILKIDNFDVRGLQCGAVKQLMSERAKEERIIKVLSVVRTSGTNDNEDECEDKKKTRNAKKKRKSKSKSKKLHRRLVVAPAGKVGVVLRNAPTGPEVHTVKQHSPLLGSLLVGDRVVEVNGTDATKMNAKEITKLMARNMDHERRIVILSTLAATAREKEKNIACADAIKGSESSTAPRNSNSKSKDENIDEQCSETLDTVTETTSKQSSAASNSEPLSSSASSNQEKTSREELSIEISRDTSSANDTSTYESESCNKCKSNDEVDDEPLHNSRSAAKASSFAFEGRRKDESLHQFWSRRKQAMALGSTKQIETSSVLKPDRKRASTEVTCAEDESSAAPSSTSSPRSTVSTTRFLSTTTDIPLLLLQLSSSTNHGSAEICCCRNALSQHFVYKVKEFEGTGMPPSHISSREYVVVLHGPAPRSESEEDGILRSNRWYRENANEWAVVSPLVPFDSAKARELQATSFEPGCDSITDIQDVNGQLSTLLEAGDHTSALNLLSRLLPKLYEQKKAHGMMSREFKFCTEVINSTCRNIAAIMILFQPSKEGMRALTGASDATGDIASMAYRALAFYATDNHARASHLFANAITKIEKDNAGRTCPKALNNLACSLYTEDKHTESRDALLHALQALLYGRYSKREDSVSTIGASVSMARRQIISPFTANETEVDDKTIDLIISLFCNLAKVSVDLQEYADARECIAPLVDLFDNVEALKNHSVRSSVMKISAELLVAMEKIEEAMQSYENLLELLEGNVNGEEISATTLTLIATEEEIIAVCDDLRNLYKDQHRGVDAVKCLRKKITHQRALLKLRIATTKM